jgi:gas vesicle protein
MEILFNFLSNPVISGPAGLLVGGIITHIFKLFIAPKLPEWAFKIADPAVHQLTEVIKGNMQPNHEQKKQADDAGHKHAVRAMNRI